MLGGIGGWCNGRRWWCSEVWRCSPKVAPDVATPHTQQMSDCDQCGIRFNLLRRRKLCGLCGLVFCGDCLKRIGLVFNGSRRCNKCMVLTQWPLDVGEVNTLRVKDLRQFLHSRHINTATCTEKRDLIDLVTRHISSQHRGSSVGSQPGAREPPFSVPQTHTQPKPQQQQPSTYRTNRDDGIRVRPTSTDTGSIRVRPVDSIRVRPGRPASPQDSADYDPDEDLGIRVFASDGHGTRDQESNVNRDHDNQLTRDQDNTHIPRGNNDHPTSCCNLDSCLNTQSPTTPTNGVDNIGFESFDAQSGSTDTTNSQSHASEEVRGRAEEATGGAGSQNQSSSSNQWSSEFQNASTNNGQWGSGLQNESTSTAPSAPSVLVLEDEEEELPSASSSSTSSSTPPSAASSPEPVKAVGEHGVLSQIVALGDLKTEEDIRGLSVRQCKELLALHRVTYAGVREKSELLAKITILWKDYQHTKKEMESLPEELVCKICMDSAIDCVLLECGHMVACTPCGKQMSECPVCRQYVVRVVRTFRA